MAKKATITPVTDTVNNAAAINTQLNAINNKLDNTLSLDGSVPNAMGADLDLNNNDLLNVGTINGASATGLSAGLTTVIGLSTDIATVAGISADVTQVAADTVAINAASANASAAAASAGAASTSETNAAASEAAAAASYDSFDDRYLGAKAVEPTLDNDGAALITGALYFNTVTGEMRVYDGAAWLAAYVSLSGALLANNNLSDLVSATTSRVNLGVAIGTDVQAYDANLNSFVGTFTLPTVDGTVDQILKTNGAGTIAFADPAAPFAPVAVTGTTPSLDIGTYNFFDNGTLSGDTTVSFASVPTQARWTYSFTADLLTTHDLENASYLQNFSVVTNSGNPYGLFFKPDGLKMYVLGNTSASVGEYNLSTAWNVSTASFLQNFSASAQDTNLRDVFFKPDGLKMYVTGVTNDSVYEYDLSTAWDVSTAVYLQLFSVAAQDLTPWSLFFKPDGTKMYVVGGTGIDINEYNLSTAWNVTTAVYLQNFSVTTQETQPRAVFFKSDGLKMYVMGAAGDDVNEYHLSAAWNIVTASYVQSFSVSAEEDSPSGLFFSTDGTKMYVCGQTGDDVNEYDTVTGTALTLPASVQNPPTEGGGAGSKATYDFYTLDGGTTVYLINEEVL